MRRGCRCIHLPVRPPADTYTCSFGDGCAVQLTHPTHWIAGRSDLPQPVVGHVRISPTHLCVTPDGPKSAAAIGEDPGSYIIVQQGSIEDGTVSHLETTVRTQPSLHHGPGGTRMLLHAWPTQSMKSFVPVSNALLASPLLELLEHSDCTALLFADGASNPIDSQVRITFELQMTSVARRCALQVHFSSPASCFKGCWWSAGQRALLQPTMLLANKEQHAHARTGITLEIPFDPLPWMKPYTRISKTGVASCSL